MMRIAEQTELSFQGKSSRASVFQDLCEDWNISLEGAWADIFGQKLKEAARTSNKPSVRTLSLFAGAGGLDIGFHDAGFEITHAVEIEKKFSRSLAKNAEQGGYIERTQIICSDVRNFSLPKNTEIDFIIGGPPCQTFSAAGRRASGVLGTTDERGTLFQEYVRLLDDLQPKGFLFENVYGIVGAEGGKPWRQIQKAFGDAGYKIFWRILDTADYGVAQHRERLIIVGTKEKEFLFPRPTHGPDSQSKLAYFSAESALKGCF